MFIVGLTGGIGSGKSAASALFEKWGIHVVDADIVAREVVELGTPALKAIASHFGQSILTQEGTLNRAELRRIIFSNEREKSWLEDLLHPIIRQSTKEQLESAQSPYAILVSPLLIETNQKELVDRILLIDVPEELQIERTVKRDNNNEEQVKSIIASQAKRATKQKAAHDIIVNDQDLRYLKQEVAQLNKKYKRLAASKLPH